MKTSDIFDTKLLNQIEIVKYICENNGVVNIDKISKSLFLDYKTVRNIWSSIEGLLEEGQELKTNNDYLFMRKKLFQESWIFDLCESLFLEHDVSVVSFLSKHYLSESMVRRKVNNVNALLKPLNLRIISRKGHLSISGNEIQIRNLAHQFFWTIFKGIEWPFKNIEDERVLNLFRNSIFQKSQVQIKEVAYAEWGFIFAINLIRFKQGHKIKNEELPQYVFKMFPLYPKEIVEPIVSKLNDEFNLPYLEQIYLLLLIQTRPQHYLDNGMLELNINIHKKINTDIYKVYTYFMNFLDNRIIYPNEKVHAESLILSSLVASSMMRGFTRPLAGYGMEVFFDEHSPNLVEKMEDLIIEIKKIYPEIELLEDIKYLSLKFSEAYGIICNMMEYETMILIGIETDLNTSLEELIVRKLEAYFYLIGNIKFITVNQKKDIPYDFIIQTSETFNAIPDSSVRKVIINPGLEEIDLSNIFDMIKEIKNDFKTS